MELNIEMKQKLEQLLAKPQSAVPADIPFVQQLIKTFPYYQPLHLLLAKASNHSENQQNAFTKAALYNGGSLVHRVIYEPQQLISAKQVNVITYEPWANTFLTNTDESPIAENATAEIVQPEAVLPTPAANHQFTAPEIENLAPLQEEILKVCEPATSIDKTETTTVETDEQETFEEISEVFAPPVDTEKETNNTEQPVNIEAPIQAQELAIETAAATDFFAFDSNFSTEVITEEAVENEITEQPLSYTGHTHENIVSKYDDDKLPFTFLWWLAKTRKNHEQIFKPFASPVKANVPTSDLQQQYVENIFHIQAPLELSQEEQSINATSLKKETQIIDNFIKNDPQIKALKAEQINNENKAKRSAEDANDLVSETLAHIYIEQMLYHKAIDTYQKLSLKFPEKSGYFADLIQSLEKKI